MSWWQHGHADNADNGLSQPTHHLTVTAGIMMRIRKEEVRDIELLLNASKGSHDSFSQVSTLTTQQGRSKTNQRVHN